MRHCPQCDRLVQPRLRSMPLEEHALHLLMSVLLCGVWLAVYAMALAKPRKRSTRCPICGCGTVAL